MMVLTRFVAYTVAMAFSTAGVAAGEDAPPAATSYRLDPAGSTLFWELPATLHTVHGTVPEPDGSIQAAPGPEGSWSVRGRVTVRAASMRTGHDSRDRTMREKVLETQRFPLIVFDVTKVTGDLSRLATQEPFTVNLEGELTIHGKSLPLELPVRVEVSGGAVLLSGSFPLRWKQYGLSDPSFAFVRVREPLRVTFRLRAVPEGEEPP